MDCPHIETATDNDHGQSSSSPGIGGRTARFIPSHRICPGLNSCLFVLMKEEGEDRRGEELTMLLILLLISKSNGIPRYKLWRSSRRS